MDCILAAIRNLGVYRPDALFLPRPLRDRQLRLKLTEPPSLQHVAVACSGALFQPQVDANRRHPLIGKSLNLNGNVEVPAPTTVFAERPGAQLKAAQAIAVPQAEFVYTKVNLPGLVPSVPALEWNPA